MLKTTHTESFRYLLTTFEKTDLLYHFLKHVDPRKQLFQLRLVEDAYHNEPFKEALLTQFENHFEHRKLPVKAENVLDNITKAHKPRRMHK